MNTSLNENLTIDSPNSEMETESSYNERNPVPVTYRQEKRNCRKQIYKCNVCHKQLMGIVMYNFHLKNKHRKLVSTKRGAEKRTFRCIICSEKMKGLFQYKSHLKNDHNKILSNPNQDRTLLKCPACKATLRRCNLFAHLKNEHNTSLDELSPFSCSHCIRVFVHFRNLLHHERTFHKSENVIQYASTMDEDSGQKTQPGGSKCNVSKLFKRKKKGLCGNSTFGEQLKDEKKKLYKRLIYPSTFTHKCNKANQKSNFHWNQNKLKEKKSGKKYTPGGVKMIYADHLYCSYCPKRFAHMHSKQLHETIHTGDTPYECTSCGASFRLHGSMVYHAKKCSALIDALWCDNCDFNCKSRDQLVRHYKNMHGCTLDAYEAQRDKYNSTSSSNTNIIVDKEISEEKFSIKAEKIVPFKV